jgi:hypothetical protein
MPHFPRLRRRIRATLARFIPRCEQLEDRAAPTSLPMREADVLKEAHGDAEGKCDCDYGHRWPSRAGGPWTVCQSSSGTGRRSNAFLAQLRGPGGTRAAAGRSI